MNLNRRKGYRKGYTGLVLVLMIALSMVIAATGLSVAADPGGRPDAPGRATPEAGSQQIDSGAHSVALTLVTGDRVWVRDGGEGQLGITVEPAERDGPEPSFDVFERDDGTYVIPSDAVPFIPGTLDLELFNVTKLIEFGYTDGVRVIVTHDRRRGPPRDPKGLKNKRPLASINAVAGRVTEGFWPVPAAGVDRQRGPSGKAQPAVDKVWLDELNEVALDESVPQIGAPAAWDAGFDGSGTTVAVLDSGIDADHPDLLGKVAAGRNFTWDETVDDEHGHGTHVASTIAGTGAASGGTFTGVAPGAELLNGKVCNSRGWCFDSWVIAGMEWAAEQDADVINMSLGGYPTDGTDPKSEAVNQLTESHDVLFVIAAGNSGPDAESVGSPAAASSALTVGAVDKADELANFSSRGPRLGDFAIKPDITAPGVDIAAARADGTSMGSPESDYYTSASGTSMAAPHVAGAATILRQQRPGLDAGDIKAMLASTAVPHDALTVYEQGGGRVDVQAAVTATVQATPAPVDLGFHLYPHDDTDPISSSVTYTNLADQAVTLDLSLDVDSDDGVEADQAMLSIEPTTLALDPGESAQATMTLDLREGDFGLYGGYLVAEHDNEVATRTPVGFYKESERVELTVVGIDRAGNPATNSSGLAVGALDGEEFLEFLWFRNTTDAKAKFRLPPGTYSVTAMFDTEEEGGRESRSLVSRPEVEVTEDMTITLDARDANPITVKTPQHPDTEVSTHSAFTFCRDRVEGGCSMNQATFMPASRSAGFYAAETEPVTMGEFAMHTGWRLTYPDLALQVTDPEPSRLDVRHMRSSALVDGDDEHALVYVDRGTAEDFQSVDAEGAIALVRMDRDNRVDWNEIAAAAEQSGAAAVVMFIEGISSAFLSDGPDGASMPWMSIGDEQALSLLELADEGEVTLRLLGKPASPYVYDLILAEDGHIPGELSYVVNPDDAEVTTVENTFYSDVEDHMVLDRRYRWHTYPIDIQSDLRMSGLPHHRTDYIVGPDSARFEHLVSAGTWSFSRFVAALGWMEHGTRSYDGGEQLERSWRRQPVRPSVVENTTGGLTQLPPVIRHQDSLLIWPTLREMVDDEGNWGWPTASNLGRDTVAMRLYEDGELVAEQDRIWGSVPFAVSTGAAEHRLELDVTRGIARDAPWWKTSTKTHTAWTLQTPEWSSSDGIHDPCPELEEQFATCTMRPLLVVDYDLEVDTLNTAPLPQERRGQPVIELQARHAGALPGEEPDGLAIAGVRLWTSYDDGETWRERPGADRGDGRYSFRLDERDPSETNGFVALRVEAWDVEDNRIEQEITRAYQLPPRD